MKKQNFRSHIIVSLVVLVIMSCGVLSNAVETQLTYTPQSTYTPYPTFTPNVSSTPEVSPTAENASKPDGPAVLYENDFSDSKNTLEIVEYERYRTSQENGVYVVEHLTGGPAYIAIPVDANNFVIDVEVSVREGPEEGATFGIGFRGQEGYDEEYYRWRLSTNGNFHLHANLAGEILPLEWFERDYEISGDWFVSTAINQGYDEKNHLRIIANEDELTFFVNDQIVMYARDSRLNNTYFALIAHADGYSITIFDNLIITEIDNNVLKEFQFPEGG